MNDAISELKIRARVLHRKVQAGDTQSLARVQLPRRSGESLTSTDVQHKHCLATVAREFGFRTWQHAVRVIRGEPVDDYGTLLVPPRCGGFLNAWFASYEQAKQAQRETGGYLLAYQRHFVVVSEAFISALGLDPKDPDWHRIGRDWPVPGDIRARERLYGKLVESTSSASKHVPDGMSCD